MSNSEASETPTEIIIDPNVTRCNENILGFAVTAIKTAEDRTLNITLQQLRDSDENLCDVTLVADDGTRIAAHRCVLAAANEYFMKMFTGSMKEAQQNEISIKDVDGDILRIIIDFLYTDKIELTDENVERILNYANLSLLLNLKKLCSRFLSANLRPYNVLKVKDIANDFQLGMLQDDARKYALLKFMQVMKCKEYLEVDFEYLSELLASTELTVDSEETVFNAAMEWINDKDESVSERGSLLEYVRMPLLSRTFFCENVGRNPKRMKTDKETVEKVCMNFGKVELVNEYYRWSTSKVQALKNSFKPLKNRSVPRKSTLKMVLITSEGLQLYCPKTYRWIKLNVSPMADNCEFKGCSFADQIIIFSGGRDANQVSCLQSGEHQTVSLEPMLEAGYNYCMLQSGEHQTKTVSLKPMFEAGYNYCMIAIDDLIYFLGAQGVNRIYDTNTDEWLKMPAMRKIRSGFGVAELNNCLFAIGGSSEKTVECFDLSKQVWSFKASMINERCNLGVGVCNGYLYAVGGSQSHYNQAKNSLCSVERYNSIEDKWTVVASLREPRMKLSVGVFRGSLFAVGGKTKDDKLSNMVERYDVEKDEWIEVTPILGTNPSTMAVVSIHYNQEP